MTQQSEIERWVLAAKERGSTHLIVVCDTFDWEDYPVQVHSNEDVREVIKKYDGVNMQKIMEVYNLSMDIKKQLAEHRAYNL